MIHRGGDDVEVIVAACSGSAKLSETIGLPVVHIDAVRDANVAIRRLNEREYASGVRVERIFQPLGFDRGWVDWGLFHYEPGLWKRGMGTRPDGVRVSRGRLMVALPPGVLLAEFREELKAALRHLRLHEVTSGMAYMEARSEACLEYTVHPRYTPNPATRDFQGASRVDDLYVLDPAEAPWRLFWTVVTARLATINGERA